LSSFDASTPLIDLASTEVMKADLSAGDPTVSRAIGEIQNAVGTVSRVVRQSVAEAEQLKNNDLLYPDGKTRLLAEMSSKLDATASGQLDKAEIAIDIAEMRLTLMALQHDPVNDVALREEVGHRTANLKASDAGVTLTTLAANSRYSTLLAGPLGESLCARFGIDHGALVRAALQSLAQNGTDKQRRAAAALAKGVPQARRSVALARAGAKDAGASIREPKRAARSGFPI
jgi:hypothetical protein